MRESEKGSGVDESDAVVDEAEGGGAGVEEVEGEGIGGVCAQ